jgi:hypothetical protein
MSARCFERCLQHHLADALCAAVTACHSSGLEKRLLILYDHLGGRKNRLNRRIASVSARSTDQQRTGDIPRRCFTVRRCSPTLSRCRVVENHRSNL